MSKRGKRFFCALVDIFFALLSVFLTGFWMNLDRYRSIDEKSVWVYLICGVFGVGFSMMGLLYAAFRLVLSAIACFLGKDKRGWAQKRTSVKFYSSIPAFLGLIATRWWGGYLVYALAIALYLGVAIAESRLKKQIDSLFSVLPKVQEEKRGFLDGTQLGE